MAADVVLDAVSSNPCCSELKKRYARLEEKRNALRQAVKLLETQTNKLDEENNVLRKAYEDEHARAEVADKLNKDSLEKKLALEKEIQQMKTEIGSSGKKGSSKNEERNQLLVSQVSEGKAEIKRLNGLLQKEIKRGDSQRKKVEEEKNKAVEAWKLLKIEKQKANDEKRIAEEERKKAEESRREAAEAREKLIAEQLKLDAIKKKLDLATQKSIQEKKRADSERADIEEKKRLLEKERAVHDELLKRLHEEKQKLLELQQKLELFSSNEKGVMNKLGKIRNGGETEMSKLLRDKIKFQKQKLKHANKVIKQHEAEKLMLLQQLYLLKQDHVQFSHRLEMLTSCFPYALHGNSNLNKFQARKPSNRPTSKPQGAPSLTSPDVSFQIESEAVKNIFAPTEYHGTSMPRGRGYVKSVPGTSSDLESSPVRDSIRDKSQSSAICSTDVIFSDTLTVGSQGRSVLAIVESTDLDTGFQVSPSLNPVTAEIIHPRSVPLNRKEHSSAGHQLTGVKRKCKEIIESRPELKSKKQIRSRQMFRRKCDQKTDHETSVENFDGVEQPHDGSSTEAMDLAKVMKLLEFDDEEEEKRYQEARKMLLSPNLPEIRSPRSNKSSDELNIISNDALNLGISEEETPETTHQHDLTTHSSVETVLHNADKSSHEEIITAAHPLENQKNASAETALLTNVPFKNEERRTCTETEDDDVNPSDVPDRGAQDSLVGNQSIKNLDSVAQVPISKQDKPNPGDQSLDRSIIVSSFMKDEQAFSRILNGVDVALLELTQAEGNGFMLRNLLRITSNDDTLTKEKVSIICSLLVNKMAEKISTPVDISSLSGYFSTEVDQVLSDEVAKALFLRLCQVFMQLLQDFIVSDKIMVCKEEDSQTRSDISHADATWFFRPAHHSQFISACIISAVTSSALNTVDILWFTLYQLLQSNAGEQERFLKAVHIFASASHEKLFSASMSWLPLPSVITLIISHLEKGLDSGEELFGGGSACPEKVASLLIEGISANLRNKDDSAGKIYDVNIDCQGKQRVFCPLWDVDSGPSHFIDVLSLVELAGRFLGWEWLRRSIIPQLFSLLDLHPASPLSASILVLIGQLIRIGIKSGGAQVEEDSDNLISRLSGFLDREREGETGCNFAAQILAVQALLCLLPLDFREIIDDQIDDGRVVRERQRTCMQLIRRWFSSGIGKDIEALIMKFFVERTGKP